MAQKSATDDSKRIEQIFPDSWVATTAPLALGCLTDVASELVAHRHQEGQDTLWPFIAEQFTRWMVGRIHPIDDNPISDIGTSWFPCEALVRIAANELLRLPRRVLSDSNFSKLDEKEQKSWVSLLMTLFSKILMENNHIPSEVNSTSDFERILRHCDAPIEAGLTYSFVLYQSQKPIRCTLYRY